MTKPPRMIRLALLPYLLFLSAATGHSQSWRLDGNGGTTPPSQFLGTTDNKPLLIKTFGTEAMRIDSSGKVGIGVQTPTGKLHVRSGGDFNAPQLVITQTTPQDFARLRFESFDTDPANPSTPRPLALWDIAAGAGVLNFFVQGGSGNVMSLSSNGRIGVGTTRPVNKLHVVGDAMLIEAPCTEQGCIFSGVSLSSDGVLFASGQGDSLTLRGTEGVFVKSDLSVDAKATVKVLQITGGSDLAESFLVAESAQLIPGAILVIDEANPGKLKMASTPYDRKVAGVVSGANGVRPGITLQQEGSSAQIGLTVSLSGRVYCLADASYGPIEPGDLLTTSSTPGRAMKVINHRKAQGAVIGKAMTALREGQGLILVLVALQ